MKTTFYALFMMILSVLSGCNLSEMTPIPVVQSTAPYVRIAQAETAIVATSDSRPVQPISTATQLPPTPSPQATQSPFDCSAGVPSREHIQHTVNVTIDYAAKQVAVAQTTRFYNIRDVALPELILDVQANNSSGIFEMQQLTINTTKADFGLNRNRLIVPLPEPINPGCMVTLNLEFTLDVPEIGIGVNALKGFFGYSPRQMNLGLWLPTVAPHIPEGWLLHEPQSIGEQIVLEQADWDVTLILENAPDDLRIAAPGAVRRVDENTWHILHQNARDFTVSLGDGFLITRERAANGVQIELYHYADTQRSVNGASLDGALHAVSAAVQAMEQYSTLFGPYPDDRLVIVQGDFPDGMEFSGIVFVSTNWFYAFEGGVQNFLTVITVHEVAHQWWYASIGSDNAYAPWLDEAFSTYSEYIFYEEFYPQLREWWWSFRVAWYNPQGNVDSDVYDYDNGRAYINAVYLRGAQMLHNLREDIGTEEFFDLLAQYTQMNSGRIATPEQFWSLFAEKYAEPTRDTREAFLANPDVVPEPIGGGG